MSKREIATEYTSLDISKSLTGTGFEADWDKKWVVERHEHGGDDACLVGDEWCGIARLFNAYRADILMEWLLARGETLSEGAYGDGFRVSFHRYPWDYVCDAHTLPDAFAKVALALLERGNGHDNKLAQIEKDKEIRWLRCDIDALEKFLAELPANRAIERLGFEEKKKEEEELLAALDPREKAS